MLNKSFRIASAAGLLALGAVGGFFLNAQRVIQAQPEVRPPVVIPKELTSYRDIVKKVVPAVVSIESKAKAKRPVRQAERQVPRRFAG